MKIRFADLPKKEILFSQLEVGEFFVFRKTDQPQLLGLKQDARSYMHLEEKKSYAAPDGWTILVPREVEITVTI